MKSLLANWLPGTGQLPGKKPLLPVPAVCREWMSSLLQSPQWARRRWFRLFGWPGLAGAVLLALCQMFYFSAIQPAQANLDAVRRSTVLMQERLSHMANGHAGGDLTPAEQLDEFYRAFPNDKNLLPLLEKIFKVAHEQGLNLDQGEYQVAQDRVGNLMRFQVVLPVKSGYPQIRKFIDGLRVEIPTIAMEHLQFERQKVGDSLVEAKIMLALYLERES